MTTTLPVRGCRMCGATSYRPVLARDDSGAMRPSGLFQCSSCSVVFTDPKAWRDGGRNDLPPVSPVLQIRRPASATVTGVSGD